MKLPSRTGWVGVALGVLLLAGIDREVVSDRILPNLEFDVSHSTANSQFQVFFDTGAGYRSLETAFKPIAASATLQTFSFTLPDAPLRSVRIDPLMTEGTVVVTAARLRSNSSPSKTRSLDLHRIVALHEIGGLQVQPTTGALEIVTTPQSTDSQCQLVFDQPIVGDRPALGAILAKVIPLDVSLILTGALAVLIFWVATGKTPAQWWRT